jgi:Uma2 family endonuclease
VVEVRNHAGEPRTRVLVTSKLVCEIEDTARDVSRSVHAVGQHVHEIASLWRRWPGVEHEGMNPARGPGEHVRVVENHVHVLEYHFHVSGTKVGDTSSCYRVIVLDVLTMIPPETIRPLSRAEYDRMVALGWFEDERIELLHGMLVTMSRQSPRHVAIIRTLGQILVPAMEERGQVQIHGPLALTDGSEPEPDVALIPFGYDDDLPDRAYLVIEVADSSLRKDRGVKARLYAAAGTPEYWIVNIADRAVEVHRAARDGAYREIIVCRSGDTMTVTAFPDIQIAVDEIF